MNARAIALTIGLLTGGSGTNQGVTWRVFVTPAARRHMPS
jgi:hypothetical protein